MYKGQRIIRLVGIILVGLGTVPMGLGAVPVEPRAVPMVAQEENVPVSAGTDFYFTVFKHKTSGGDGQQTGGGDGQQTGGEDDRQHVFLQITGSSSDNSMIIYIDGKRTDSNNNFGTSLSQIHPHPMSVVHITTTRPTYLSAFVKGESSGAETAILPTHLLGTSYMLQSMPGALVELEGVLTQTYAQFSVVSTSTATSFTVKTPVDLICVSNGQVIPAGTTARFALAAEKALLFQPADYTKDISGVQIHSVQPVAVFQGNNLTRIYPGENGADYTWEQARPVSNWGTEFVIPKSALLQFNIAKVTALHANTDVYCWVNGSKMLMKTLDEGESYARVFDTGTSGTLDAIHIQTTKPSCCYLYFTGSARNNGVGDPAMTEIIPMDRPSTHTRWVMTHPADNAPYQIRLLVTMRADNEENVLINNYPASTYNLPSVTTEEYISYEMTYSAVQSMKIQATEGGFSAYTMHVGNVAEASAMSVALPEIPSPPELCTDGTQVFLKNSSGSWSVKTETVSGFCAGSNLSFSALVSFQNYSTVKAAVTDPDTGAELAQYERHFEGEEVETQWYNGREWYKIGLNYTVPEGMSDLAFEIENDYNAYIDSFEVRLCTPPVTIIAQDTVCIDTKNILTAAFENDGSFAEPLEYQWYFSADSVNWTPVTDGHERELKLKAKPRHTGWYKVAVAGNGNIDNEKCRAMSAPHKFFVIEDCPPILCPEGVLLFREDFGGNDPDDPRVSQTPVRGMSYTQLQDDYFGIMRSGSYLVTKSGYCNGDTTQSNAPQNRRSQWHLQDDHTYPGDYTRGYFLEIDGKGDNASFYSTTIDNLCAGTDLSFIAYVANVMTWGQYVGSPGRYAYPRLRFVLTNPVSGTELGAYDTGEIPFDSTFINDYSCWSQSSKWHQVGMNFTVPEGISSVTLTIYNNSLGTTGNDFAIDDIEIRLCLEPVSIDGTSPACRKKPHSLQAVYDNYGIIETPEFRWAYSADSINWTVLQTGSSKEYTIPEVHKSDEGWYKVTVANTGNSDYANCRGESEPFKLSTQYCQTAVEQSVDTVACDTLMPVTWRRHEWVTTGTVTDTVKDFEDDDSVYVHLTLQNKICCPYIRTYRIDSAVCDTLIPFMWFFRDTALLYEEPGEEVLEYIHPKWQNCIDEVYTLGLDTFHCERLYPIIVNKYNWQLLLDYVALRRLFPEQTATAFQWYKDEAAISGATDDDYAEENELHGRFQLCVQMSDGLYVWSNILDITDTPAPLPVTKRIYNAQGMPVGEGQMTHGVYLIHYRQGEKTWTEKKIVH